MKSKLEFLIMCFWVALILSSCCTKKACGGLEIQEINLVFQGFTTQQLDSISINEYNKTSNQLIKSIPVRGYYYQLGSLYVYIDSFYLNQRYFVITPQNDTINNIGYQVITQPINCNICFLARDNEFIHKITNFSFNYNGKAYNQRDTVYIIK